MPVDAYFELTCSACGKHEIVGPLQMLERLRAAGMLKREKEPDWELVCELFRTQPALHSCVNCGSDAVLLAPYVERAEDWEETRRCERCQTKIPLDRLEVFPDTRLCVACQQRHDRDEPEGEPEYCPRCGTIMQLRLSRSSGIAHYLMYCPACGRQPAHI
ncbi:MAG: TraR/DksA family transcriptional regulator [Pirellulaceae bacterium]